MKRSGLFLTLPLAGMLAGQASAQPRCSEPIGPVDPCIVGFWLGISTAPDAIQRVLGGHPYVIDVDVTIAEAEVGFLIHPKGDAEALPQSMFVGLVSATLSGTTSFDAAIVLPPSASWATARDGVMAVYPTDPTTPPTGY